jgi:hypothetical protein
MRKQCHSLSRLRVGLAVSIVLAISVAGSVPVASAQGNPNPRVLPPNSRPYGLTYTDWAVKWVQWAMAIPAGESPFSDPDGRFCHVGQAGPVFFLGNNFGGTTVRSCAVPAGKALLISPGGSFCILHVDAETDQGLRDCVEQNIAGIANVRVDVDGVTLRALTRYFVAETPFFSITLPADNILSLFGLDVPPGEYTTLLAGFAVLLHLPAGQHVVHFHDEFPAFGFVSDVTYMLDVGPLR